MSKDTKFKDTWTPQYLYIQQHIIEPEQIKAAPKNSEEEDDANRGVVIIDILSD